MCVWDKMRIVLKVINKILTSGGATPGQAGN